MSWGPLGIFGKGADTLEDLTLLEVTSRFFLGPIVDWANEIKWTTVQAKIPASPTDAD